MPGIQTRQPLQSLFWVAFRQKFADVDPIAILKAGVRTVRHHKLGWLREDLLANGFIDGTKEALYIHAYSQTFKHNKSTSGLKKTSWETISTLCTSCLAGRDEEGRFSFTKNVDVPKNYLSQVYLLHAYDVSESTFRRLRARHDAPLEKQISHN